MYFFINNLFYFLTLLLLDVHLNKHFGMNHNYHQYNDNNHVFAKHADKLENELFLTNIQQVN